MMTQTRSFLWTNVRPRRLDIRRTTRKAVLWTTTSYSNSDCSWDQANITVMPYGHYSVSDHWQHNSFKGLSRLTRNKISKLRIPDRHFDYLRAVDSLHAQRPNNAESVSLSWLSWFFSNAVIWNACPVRWGPDYCITIVWHGNSFRITGLFSVHDDVIKWKHFPRYWPFVRGIHRSRWIPHTKASDAELWCLLWSAPE